MDKRHSELGFYTVVAYYSWTMMMMMIGWLAIRDWVPAITSHRQSHCDRIFTLTQLMALLMVGGKTKVSLNH